METTNDKASIKLFEIIKQTEEANFKDWNEQKDLIKYIVQQHINNAYMIDKHYYKAYKNFWHEVLILLNEL